MKPANKPKLIIFDLGRVLVDYDFHKVVRDLARHSTRTEAEIHHYFATTPLWDIFERGQIAPEDFYNRLTRELKLEGLIFQTFAPLWNSIFTKKDDTVAIVRRLRGQYRLALLSNVNVMHWNYIREQHDFMNWFELPVPSYETGYRKPDLEIFQLTLKKAGVEAVDSIFIDDVESHITAARSLGIRAHQFISAEQLESDLNGVLS